MTGVPEVVVDIAGSGMGGAARWAGELAGFRRKHQIPITVIGRRRRLTGGWLLRRERAAAGARIAVAANNVSFLLAGEQRRVVLRNVLHFLRPSEEHLLASMPVSFRVQIPVVRRVLERSGVIVAPTTTMADRVCRAVPSARDRVVVRPHPVSPIGARRPAEHPFILVPVLPAPYKNLVPQLATLLAALDRTGAPAEVRVTATAADLPGGLAHHPRLIALGRVPYGALAELWQQAAGVFFPSSVESFGYPLAEARVYGVPVLAPGGEQARELAGSALRPYRSGDLHSLAAAVARLAVPVAPEPYAYDRDEYFQWLFGLPAGHRRERETHGITS